MIRVVYRNGTVELSSTKSKAKVYVQPTTVRSVSKAAGSEGQTGALYGFLANAKQLLGEPREVRKEGKLTAEEYVLDEAMFFKLVERFYDENARLPLTPFITGLLLDSLGLVNLSIVDRELHSFTLMDTLSTKFHKYYLSFSRVPGVSGIRVATVAEMLSIAVEYDSAPQGIDPDMFKLYRALVEEHGLRRWYRKPRSFEEWMRRAEAVKAIALTVILSTS